MQIQENELSPAELIMIFGSELIPGELAPKRNFMEWGITNSRQNKRETILSINGLRSKTQGVSLSVILNNQFGFTK